MGLSVDDYAWLAAVAVFFAALLLSRGVRRALYTAEVALRALGRFLGARLRGAPGDAPRQVRIAFEQLGPTYLKLGQIIASSHGLFPERYCVEFGKCLDRVQPFPFATVCQILVAELGRPVDQAFAALDPQPLASASIAQVHAARLADGSDVVVKVQRPGIAARIDDDLRILHVAARVLAALPFVELANPEAIIEDFDTTLHQELDFVREAASMDEWNRIMRELGHADIAAPTVNHALTTARALVMERFYGIRIDDVAQLRARKIDAEARLIDGLRGWFQSMIFYGFFHGDVHAGNLMSLDDGRLGFLDFGIVGRFPPLRRRQIADYVVAFATADFRRLADVMVEMGSVERDIDLPSLAKDLERAYAPMLGKSFAALNYGDLLPTLLAAAARHKMRLPSEFVLVTKQLLYFDRYAKLLAPNLNVFTDPRLVAGMAMDIAKARALYADLR